MIWKYNLGSVKDNTSHQTYQQKLISNIHDERAVVKAECNMENNKKPITSLITSIRWKMEGQAVAWIKQSTINVMEDRNISWHLDQIINQM